MRESVKPAFATQYYPGDTISGRYILEELLGEGGMGAVWRARNMALDAPVAIKVLSARIQHSSLKQRLLLEARAAAKLAHPAIVKVFDVGETERAEPYIVMELLSGTSLGSVLRDEGRLSAVQAVRTLLPIADALQVAHNKRIVHRDVKPDNIFIVHDEGVVQPKLVDFGVVKVEQSEGSGALTRDGTVMGSPAYLSPEQARGADDIDHRADVWALSVVLFETISGRMPFEADNYNALLRQILEQNPPTLRELLVADEALSAIVARGLQKPCAERFQSVAEMGRALAQWLFDTGETQDICGIALESKWLQESDRRQSTAFGVPWRAEPGSGVRRPIPLPASTIPAPATATAESSLTATLTRPSRAKLLIVIGGLATVAATGLLWAMQRNAVVSAPAVAKPSALAAPAPTPTAPPSLPAVSIVDTGPAASVVPPASAPPPSPVKAKSPASKKALITRKPRSQPKSDLLKPY